MKHSGGLGIERGKSQKEAGREPDSLATFTDGKWVEEAKPRCVSPRGHQSQTPHPALRCMSSASSSPALLSHCLRGVRIGSCPWCWNSSSILFFYRIRGAVSGMAAGRSEEMKHTVIPTPECAYLGEVWLYESQGQVQKEPPKRGSCFLPSWWGCIGLKQELGF